MVTLLSRRDLLRGHVRQGDRISPPGLERPIAEICEQCRACLDHCPTSIISMQSGMPAIVSFDGCNFCGQCREHCPHSGVFFGADMTFPHTAHVLPHCLSLNSVDCQSCRDHCPTDAIRFRPRAGGPWYPEVAEDDCTGCGACIGHCPTNAISLSVRSGTHVDAQA
ncbi:ferredoxin-type protein NapF [Agrobacterium vitis]|uniref:ferredoxin-type protein NapF n=1 Tax=Agrobacterium vitis TaxID=373 RepID=UPI0009BCD285|nr:ferredoxin-type protein NapF [Agrobacterium vitis]MUO85275.1 4Fe-4S dicluster domain-containing protein [Agrobacterium vitis]